MGEGGEDLEAVAVNLSSIPAIRAAGNSGSPFYFLDRDVKSQQCPSGCLLTRLPRKPRFGEVSPKKG